VTSRSIGVAVYTLAVLLLGTDLVLRAVFPHFLRLTDNFSSMYLQREVALVARDPSAIVVLGDSALWGYRVPADEAAITQLRAGGCDCRNLSFEGGSPANTYAMLRLLTASDSKPKLVVFNVNQKEFNPADSAYQTIHPSVETLAWPLLTAGERAGLTSHPPHDWNGVVDAVISRWWALYGLRSDMREALFGDVDAVHAVQTFIEDRTGARARAAQQHTATADRFEGTYDLTPLAGESDNVSVAFLRRVGQLARTQHLRMVALLTPTNHALLHEYIDTPAYSANLSYTKRLLQGYGIVVVDLDRAIPAGEFLDNDHLTQAGNQRLAAILRPVIATQ
jgi:lysophospholipase L1-like esterase